MADDGSFSPSCDEEAGEDRGGPIRWNIVPASTQTCLLSPALSSITWRRGGTASGISGALSSCARAAGRISSLSLIRAIYRNSPIFCGFSSSDKDSVKMHPSGLSLLFRLVILPAMRDYHLHDNDKRREHNAVFCNGGLSSGCRCTAPDRLPRLEKTAAASPPPWASPGSVSARP